MLDFLAHIFEVMKAFPQLVLYAIVSGINALVFALGSFIAFMIGLFPQLPDAPGAPDSGILQWVNYFLPLGGLLALFTTFVTVWIAFLAIKIGLKWVKAL
jgi:uncharacterized membrane protein